MFKKELPQKITFSQFVFKCIQLAQYIMSLGIVTIVKR